MTTTMPFLAFATDVADIKALRDFATARGWTDNAVLTGNIKDAAEYLKNNASPGVLLVEIPSQAEAAALLDGLSEVCAPETKVIVTGNVNEYSFYCWLTDIGISSYLLKPLTERRWKKPM
jgi:pilus assembly protein CpaE